MEYQGLDLAYETKCEMGWTQQYAAGAVKEYNKWLKLRADANDFEACKLSPSRAVAVVWNVHRQWTHDYTKTCSSLGGFIHHYPPAMRLGVSREHAYANTYQQYKAFFHHDPPGPYWGNPMSGSGAGLGANGNTNSSFVAEPIDPKSTAAPTRASLRTSPRRERTSAPRKPPSFSRPRRKSASAMKEAAAAVAKALESDSDDLPAVTIVEMDLDSLPLSALRDDLTDHLHNRTLSNKDKTVRTPRGGRKIQDGLVLKPLAPGAKRRRGRPSLSEYVHLAGKVTAPPKHSAPKSTSLEQITPIREKPSGANKTPSSISKKRASTSISRGRGRARQIAPRPTDSTPRRPATSASKNAPSASVSVARPTNGDSPAQKKQPNMAYTAGPDGSPVLLKRPRGRPRKDGSWPIPRTKPLTPQPSPSSSKEKTLEKSDKQSVSPPVDAPQPTLPLPSTTQPSLVPPSSQEGFMLQPAAAASSANGSLGHPEVPITLDMEVNQQILANHDTTRMNDMRMPVDQTTVAVPAPPAPVHTSVPEGSFAA